MSIEKKCENCLFSSEHYPPFKMVCIDCHYAQNDKDDIDTCFQAKEELVRQDEKEKVYKNIKKFIRVNMRNGCEDTIEKLLKELKIWIS